MRPIDADALKDRLQALAYDDWNQGANTSWAEAFSEVAEMVEEQPTIDAVQERKGRWVELYDSNYKCSECGAWWHSDDMDINEEFRFCPSCGAHMEGVEDAGRDE